MPSPAHRRREKLNHPHPGRGGHATGAGEHFECESLHRIAGQNGRRLVERRMTGRTAPTQVIVVHGRQVVVYQGIGVEVFDGRRRIERSLHGTAERDTGAADDRGPQALTPAEGHVAHGFDQVRRNIGVPG